MTRTEQPLLVGQKWYVRAPGKSEVQEATIRQLTTNTVLLEIGDVEDMTQFGFAMRPDVKRFVTADVRWIEKLEEAV